ncbi:hypothetical protein TcCL_Unassigned00648 [Trypanosoma cruzi]|nr:hypothetical protein TcCL_Unassigned00648 [Trypanosoma cruzi]
MAASQGGPDAVHDTQEPRQTAWQRYDRQPSSAYKRCWCWWCGSGVESSPAPSSQSVASRSRESALHSRQRQHARTASHKEGNKEARRQHLVTGKRVHVDCIPIGSQTSGW